MLEGFGHIVAHFVTQGAVSADATSAEMPCALVGIKNVKRVSWGRGNPIGVNP